MILADEARLVPTNDFSGRGNACRAGQILGTYLLFFVADLIYSESQITISGVGKCNFIRVATTLPEKVLCGVIFLINQRYENSKFRVILIILNEAHQPDKIPAIEITGSTHIIIETIQHILSGGDFTRVIGE